MVNTQVLWNYIDYLHPGVLKWGRREEKASKFIDLPRLYFMAFLFVCFVFFPYIIESLFNAVFFCRESIHSVTEESPSSVEGVAKMCSFAHSFCFLVYTSKECA